VKKKLFRVAEFHQRQKVFYRRSILSNNCSLRTLLSVNLRPICSSRLRCFPQRAQLCCGCWCWYRQRQRDARNITQVYKM